MDMAMRRIFWGFCINRFSIGPLHYVSSRSNFGFEFAEIFVIEKQLPDLPSRGVDKNAYRCNLYHCERIYFSSTLSCSKEEERITKPHILSTSAHFNQLSNFEHKRSLQSTKQL